MFKVGQKIRLLNVENMGLYGTGYVDGDVVTVKKLDGVSAAIFADHGWYCDKDMINDGDAEILDDTGFKVGQYYEILDAEGMGFPRDHEKEDIVEVVGIDPDGDGRLELGHLNDLDIENNYVRLVADAPDEDGWQKWYGANKHPVEKGTLIDVKYRDGHVEYVIPALEPNPCSSKARTSYNWSHTLGAHSDIVAFRVCGDQGVAPVTETVEAHQSVLDQKLATEDVTAPDIVKAALSHMEDRASTYDSPEGERSMSSTVEAFNAITGDGLMNTEERGWLFMCILKMVRSQKGDFKMDNYEDLSAYAGLTGEAAYKERHNGSD